MAKAVKITDTKPPQHISRQIRISPNVSCLLSLTIIIVIKMPQTVPINNHKIQNILIV
jgi:hypothetical protein